MLEQPVFKRLAACAAALACFFGLTGFGDDSPIPFFPSMPTQNDALCQSYGYPPGSQIYARCRARKDQISGDSRAAAVPDVTPIPLLLFFDRPPQASW